MLCFQEKKRGTLAFLSVSIKIESNHYGGSWKAAAAPESYAFDIYVLNDTLYRRQLFLFYTKNRFFSECLLRFGVLRVFVLFCVFVFVWAILSWCP